MNPLMLKDRIKPKPLVINFHCQKKRKYRSLLAAERALRAIRLSPERRLLYPRSAYYCLLHDCYHLSHHLPDFK